MKEDNEYKKENGNAVRNFGPLYMRACSSRSSQRTSNPKMHHPIFVIPFQEFCQKISFILLLFYFTRT